MTARGTEKPLRRGVTATGHSSTDPALEALIPTGEQPLPLGSFVSGGGRCAEQGLRAAPAGEPRPWQEQRRCAGCAPGARQAHAQAGRAIQPGRPQPRACAQQACPPVAGLAPPATVLGRPPPGKAPGPAAKLPWARRAPGFPPPAPEAETRHTPPHPHPRAPTLVPAARAMLSNQELAGALSPAPEMGGGARGGLRGPGSVRDFPRIHRLS